MKSDCLNVELALIRDDTIRDFVKEYLDKFVPDYFYTVPASSTGKYHPSYALGVGGLVRHTKATVIIARELLELEQYSHLNRDEIFSALIIHDTFKHGLKEGHTAFEHPVFSAKAIILFAKEYHPEMLDVARSIAKLVITHMGQWTTSKKSNIILPKPQTDAEKFVHLCDYLASRKCITIEVEYEPSEEKEEQQK